MASPRVSSKAYSSQWDVSPDSRGTHQRRQNRSPRPVPPPEPVAETRRIVMRSKPPESKFGPYAARSLNDLLRTSNPNSSKDDGASDSKRPRSSVVVVPKSTLSKSTDRVKQCPVLIRVFYSTEGRHNPVSAFSNKKVPSNEVCISTWMNASLKELAYEIIYAIKMLPENGGSGSADDIAALNRKMPTLRLSRPIRLHFSSVYPDFSRCGGYRKRDLGACVLNAGAGATAAGSPNDDAEPHIGVSGGDVTLESKNFQLGDFLDVAISNVDETRVGGHGDDGGRGSAFNNRRVHDRLDHRF